MLVYIRIFSQDIILQTEIDEYVSLQFERSWHGVGMFQLVINRHIRGTEHLEKGNYIILGDDSEKSGIILHKEIELDESGKETENWLIIGLSLKGLCHRRITYPPQHTAYDSITADTETVMQHYIKNNIIAPSEVDRVIERVVLSTNQNRGQRIQWQSRFKVLSEELQRMSILTGLGWFLDLDVMNKQIIFNVKEGKNLTASQNINPRVILSPEFDSIRAQSYMDSDLDYRNVGIVAGQGEGVERRILQVGNASGINRLETFIDARDIAEKGEDEQPIPEEQVIEALQQRGEEKLNELATQKLFEASILEKSPFEYQRDYDIGDIVTIQNIDWGITLDSRIIGMKEIYEPSGFKLEAKFGNDWPNLISKLKQELAQMSGEVRR